MLICSFAMVGHAGRIQFRRGQYADTDEETRYFVGVDSTRYRRRGQRIAWILEEAGYTVVLQAWDFRPGSNWLCSLIAVGCASSPGAPPDIAVGSTVLSGVGTPSTP